MGAFDDLLSANADFADAFVDDGLPGQAAQGLAIVTCMDSRIEPLAMLGLKRGDAKILRNAGGRVTGDVLRTLVLATHLLGVTRVLVVEHTECKMASATEDQVHEQIQSEFGIDTRSLDFKVMDDQLASLKRDVQRVRSSPYLPKELEVGGFLLDVRTGRLREVC
ncbi:MAG: putative carbonate hydratase [Frankiales bacterium]|nr:putative carbonate hydratase [Frankiales bacterium]